MGSCVAIQFILQVEQSYALIPMEQQFAAIYHALRRHAEETPDHKVRRQGLRLFGCLGRA